MSTELPEPSDEQLVARTLAGHDQAYAALALRYRPKIAGMAARFANQTHEAEDLIQEIFIQAWRKLDQFKGGAPFEHWLSRIAIRKCYDLLRQRQRHKEDLLEPERWDRMRDLAAQAQGAGGSGDWDPASARELLSLAMKKLAPEEKLIITLLELDEYSVKEISEQTGWSESKVKVRAHRARHKLKAILEELK